MVTGAVPAPRPVCWPHAFARGGVGEIRHRSNAIAPVRSPPRGAWSKLLPPGELIERFDMARVPLGRMGEHHELADLVTYLISPLPGTSPVSGHHRQW